jgi:hypothetical protein
MSKNRVNIISWVKSGVLANVRPGQSKSAVMQALGTPFGWLSTASEEPVEDYQAANVWGYGVWSLYFDGEMLDAVTCIAKEVDERGWYFDVEKEGGKFHLRSIDEVESLLISNGMPVKRIDDGFLSLKNNETGEIVRRTARCAESIILTGDELQTRILFEKTSGRMTLIANPFCVRVQAISWKCTNSKRNIFSLV